MRMRLAVMAMVMLTAAAAIALQREPTTQPAAPKAAESPADAWPWARTACVLAGLAVVGVIWLGWSMRTLAKNQVELGRMILAAMAKKD